MKKKYPIYIVAVVAVIGALGFFASLTTWDIGLSPDSLSYITAARNLSHGKGLSILSPDGELVAMTHFPPLYPVLIAILARLGSMQGALWIGAVFFGTNIFLAGFIINKYTRSLWATLAGSLLVISSSVMIYISSMAWTEPLALFFIMLGIYLLALYLQEEQRKQFIGSAIMFGLAFLTRYAAAAFVGSAIIGIILLKKSTLKKRLTDSAAFGVISILPMILWLARNFFLTGSTTNRSSGFHLMSKVQLNQMLSTFASWLPINGIKLLAGNYGYIFLFLAVSILVTGLIIAVNKKVKTTTDDETGQHIDKLPALLIIFIAVYMLFLFVVVSFIDFYIIFDVRLLSCVLMFCIILVTCALKKRFLFFNNKRLPHFLSVLCVVVLLGLQIIAGGAAMNSLRKNGPEKLPWQTADFISEIRGIPNNMGIYSNVPDIIYYFTERQARFLPRKKDPSSNTVSKDYRPNMLKLKKQLENKEMVVIYMDAVRRWYLPGETELDLLLPGLLISRRPYGSLYGASGR